MRRCGIATLILLNGPPGVGKSTIARRLRDDRPLSLLVDFDELWLLLGDWQHNEKAQELAITAGLAMARAHLEGGHDVIAAQFAVGAEFFEVVDAIVDETSAVCQEIVLTGQAERVARQFRRRRTERTLVGEHDVSANISDDRLDEVIAWATRELAALAEARPRTMVISTDTDADSTYLRVREVLQGRDAELGR